MLLPKFSLILFNAVGTGTGAPRMLGLPRAPLTQPGLCDKVVVILAASGMPAAQLQREITESLAAQGVDIQLLLGLKLDCSFVRLAASSPHTRCSSRPPCWSRATSA